MPCGTGGFSFCKNEFAAYHAGDEVGFGSVADSEIAGVSPSSKDGHRVGHGKNLRELVRDEEHRVARGAELPEKREEILGLSRRQHRSRFIEDQYAGAPVKGLENFNLLLHSHGKLVDPRKRVDFETVFLPERIDLRRCGIPRKRSAVVRRKAEHDVLPDGMHGNKREVLMNHADA